MHTSTAIVVAATVAGTSHASPVPKGFNSWDSFKGDVNETEFIAISQQMKDLLLPSGYDTVTVDEFWYPNNCASSDCLDQYGRATVDVSKWPSAADGAGFKEISDKVHALGLKFGIHVMHGVPVAAKDSNATVMGKPTVSVWSLTTDDHENCPWNQNWYRVDMAKPGAQEYFDSVYALYASWGVDFIKNDCVFGENFSPLTFSNIRAARAAMDKSGRTMTYSLSPGFSPSSDNASVTADSAAIANITNLYRITSDWHGWDGADKEQGWDNHFRVAGATAALRDHSSFSGTASFPDLDMLNPFADAESFRMQQTLWSMARSPLIYGGDPRNLTATHPHVKIMTNKDVLAIADGSSGGTVLWHTGESAAMVANSASTTTTNNNKDNKDTTAKYAAFFKFSGKAGPLSASFAQLGFGASVKAATVTDLWTGEVTAHATEVTSASLQPCHTDGTDSPVPCCALYRVEPATDGHTAAQ